MLVGSGSSMELSRIGPYRIVRKLGEGGMGAVYEAEHEEIARSVAIKVLRPTDAGDTEYAARLLNEARAVNIIRHRGVVGISDLGRLPDGSPYIVMEYLEGETLRAAMRRRLPAVTLLRLARQVASGLAAAHEKGILHRDLKPENVMVVADPEVPGGQRAIVLDFGMAKLGAAQKHPATVEQQTDVRIHVGTAKYMSPEQAALERTLTDRADVYALGVMIYELLSGAPPFAASTYALLLDMHRFSAPIPLDRMAPRLDRRLVELVGQMLAKKPAERPSMDEVAMTLERILTSNGSVGKGKVRPVETPPDVNTPSPLPVPPLPQGAAPKKPRRTEPLEQLSEKSLAEAAGRLFHDSETMPVQRFLESEPTAELQASVHSEPTSELLAGASDEVTALGSSDVETMPPLRQSQPALLPRRKRRRRQRVRRLEHITAIVVAVAALIWALVAILR
jgi:serine/threonine protein kinase